MRISKQSITKLSKSKAQHSVDRQTTTILDLSSGNISKYEFLTGDNVLPEKDLLEKAAIIKRFEYSPLSSELKKQTDIAEKQNQGLDKIYEFIKKENDDDENENEDDKTLTKKKNETKTLIKKNNQY